MIDVLPPSGSSRQLALFCAQLPRLRSLHRGPVGAEKRMVIDSAVRAARAGEPVDGYLERLGVGAARTAGVPVGADEGEDTSRNPTRPPRVSDGAPHALPGYHICPREMCERREHRTADGERPVCGVFDLALRFVAEL
jgi:hypothetical protein